jgi:hypothetical protein
MSVAVTGESDGCPHNNLRASPQKPKPSLAFILATILTYLKLISIFYWLKRKPCWRAVSLVSVTFSRLSICAYPRLTRHTPYRYFLSAQ